MISVEILSRQRDVLIRHRIDSQGFRVGRGYDNEIILDDPHVAPAHLRIYRNEAGQWVAEDLGSLNGLSADRTSARLSHLVLDGETTIRIGQTLIRVRDADYPVAAERALVQTLRLWPLSLVLMAMILGIEWLGAWRTDVLEPTLATYTSPLIKVILITAVWVGIWTALCRVLSGAARFERHLRIGLSAMLCFSLVNEVAELAAFGLSAPLLATQRTTVGAIILGVAAWYHMRAIGQHRMRLKLAGAVVLPLLLIAYERIGEADQRRVTDPPLYVQHLMPPAFRLTPLKSKAAFLADLAALKPGLDLGRAKDSP